MCNENKLRYTLLHQKLMLTKNLTPNEWKEYRNLKNKEK